MLTAYHVAFEKQMHDDKLHINHHTDERWLAFVEQLLSGQKADRK
jgi:hypothetical protein